MDMMHVRGLSRVCGIELDGAVVRMVRVSRTRRDVREEVLWNDDPAADVEAWGRLTTTLQWEMGQGLLLTNGTLLASECVVRRLSAPFRSERKARRVLPSLLDIQLPFPLEQCLYCFPEMTPGEEGVEALALAVRRETLEARLARFDELGLDPAVLEHEGLAAWRAACAKTRGDCILAYVGRGHSFLVTGFDGAVQGVHRCSPGVDAFVENGQSNETALRAFTERVQRVMRARRLAADTDLSWVWCGPGAANELCRNVLETALAKEGRFAFECVDHPETFLASALARGVLFESQDVVNMRREDAVHPVVLKKGRRVQRRRQVITLLLALCLIGLNAGWMVLLNYRGAALRSALQRKAMAITGLARIPADQEVRVTQRYRVDQAETLKPFMRMFDPSLTEVVHDVLRQAQTSDMVLETMLIKTDQVSVQGTSPDWPSCEKLVRVLQANGYDANLEQRKAGADERVHFQIKGGRTL